MEEVQTSCIMALHVRTVHIDMFNSLHLLRMKPKMYVTFGALIVLATSTAMMLQETASPWWLLPLGISFYVFATNIASYVNSSKK